MQSQWQGFMLLNEWISDMKRFEGSSCSLVTCDVILLAYRSEINTGPPSSHYHTVNQIREGLKLLITGPVMAYVEMVSGNLIIT